LKFTADSGRICSGCRTLIRTQFYCIPLYPSNPQTAENRVIECHRLSLDGNFRTAGNPLEHWGFALSYRKHTSPFLVGSDTGIRTRVSAVRGRRPGPLDDIANERKTRTHFRHFPMSTALEQGRKLEVNGKQAQDLAARSSSARSIFFIFSMAFRALGFWINLGSCTGTICQESPNLSFSQPHWLSVPPASSFDQ
jgi:hypothetical protein